MNTIEQIERLEDLDSDTRSIIESAMAGKPLDSDIARRVRAQGEKLCQEIFEKHGLVDIAVPAIRELRGKLPNP